MMINIVKPEEMCVAPEPGTEADPPEPDMLPDPGIEQPAPVQPPEPDTVSVPEHKNGEAELCLGLKNLTNDLIEKNATE